MTVPCDIDVKIFVKIKRSDIKGAGLESHWTCVKYGGVWSVYILDDLTGAMLLTRDKSILNRGSECHVDIRLALNVSTKDAAETLKAPSADQVLQIC